MKSEWFWPSLPLRLVLGIIMVYHGVPKLNGGIEQFAGMLDQAGIFLPTFFAWIVALLEVVGGVLLVVGVFPLLLSALFTVNFVVATWAKVYKWDFPFAGADKTGWEFDLLILGAFVALLWMSISDCMKHHNR